MAVDVLLGMQWGDEGKGKVVDYLAESYDIIARFQGGPNAGHTLKIDGKEFVLHTIPSGIFRPNQVNLIGNGVVVDPITLRREIEGLIALGVPVKDRLIISKKAHLILPTHRLLDMASEASKGKEKIGSTLKGIGPTYMDKTGRNGLRIGECHLENFKQNYEKLKEKHLHLATLYPKIDFDLEGQEREWFGAIEYLSDIPTVNGEYYVNEALKSGKTILAEGAQGSMLDIDYGTYPYVTSSNTISAGVCTGLGVAPHHIGRVIGISKAYCTRVGGGPFPSELFDENGRELQRIGREFGATTGRSRRCGWLDLVQLKYSAMINGVSEIVLTKLDVLNQFKEIMVGVAYQWQDEITQQLPIHLTDDLVVEYTSFTGWLQDTDDIKDYEALPAAAKSYIDFIEEFMGIPVSLVSTGPEREKILRHIKD